jgi:hypothetical protein
VVWTSAGKAPINLGYRCFDNKKMLPIEGERLALPAPLPPGQSVNLQAKVAAPPSPGHFYPEDWLGAGRRDMVHERWRGAAGVARHRSLMDFRILFRKCANPPGKTRREIPVISEVYRSGRAQMNICFPISFQGDNKYKRISNGETGSRERKVSGRKRGRQLITR